jgi:hypothetical protein
MTKKRMIHDCLWQSETFATLSYRQRCLWVGLITTADDQGRGRAHPGLVRAAVFPFDIVSQEEIQEDLEAIQQLGMVLIYQVDDKAFYQVANWWEYQSPQWVGPSDFPAPEGWLDRLRYHGKGRNIVTQNWPNTADSLPDDKGTDKESRLPLAEGKGKEEGKEEEEEEDSPALILYREILSEWSELFPDKTQPKENNAKNVKKTATRMGDSGFAENWRAALRRASRSTFCNAGGWFQLAWFLASEEHWTNCHAGNYDDTKPINSRNDAPVPKRRTIRAEDE